MSFAIFSHRCVSRPAAAKEPTLTWLGHAAFEYTTRAGKVILIDPWLTNPKAPKKIDLTHVDAILVTHGHSDHVGEAFELAKKYNAPLVASYELANTADCREAYGVNDRHAVKSLGQRGSGGGESHRGRRRYHSSSWHGG